MHGARAAHVRVPTPTLLLEQMPRQMHKLRTNGPLACETCVARSTGASAFGASTAL